MLTHDNWLCHGFDRGGTEPKYADNWRIKFNHASLNYDLDFPGSISRALELIAEKNKKIIVQYSGGLDSEIIIRQACKLGIDVIPYTLRFHNNLNDHEIYYCKILEKELGIKINYIDLDIDAWFYQIDFPKGYCYYIENFDIWHPAAPQAWWLRDVIDDIEGDCIVLNGSGDAPLFRRPDKYHPATWQWGLTFNLDGHWKRLWYSNNYYPNDVPLFHMYIPEIHYSFLTHPLLKHCVSAGSFKLSSTSTRHQLYHTYYPECEPRTKYSGYEQLMDNKENLNNPSVRSYSCAMSTPHIPYEEYIRMLQV